MKSLLILNKIKVENANTIAGMVYGFPSVTHFLGYAHALSRGLKIKPGVELGGCAIICHDFQVKSYKTNGWGEHVFSLAKNPLCKDGSTPSFNEEGKVHMEVSLVIECNFTGDDLNFGTDDIDEDIKKFEELIFEMAIKRRLAGGIITSISSVNFYQVPQAENDAQKFFRKTFRKMLPGFVLKDSNEILKKHLAENPSMNSLDALLDFYVLKSKAAIIGKADVGNNKAEWSVIPKPVRGWFVPIQVGYQAISPLYKEGEVACARDRNAPFRFVESIYGLGEWSGLHRINDPTKIFWHYHHEHDMYLCLNKVNN